MLVDFDWVKRKNWMIACITNVAMTAHKGSEHVMTSETVNVVPRGTAGNDCRLTLA